MGLIKLFLSFILEFCSIHRLRIYRNQLIYQLRKRVSRAFSRSSGFVQPQFWIAGNLDNQCTHKCFQNIQHWDALHLSFESLIIPVGRFCASLNALWEWAATHLSVRSWDRSENVDPLFPCLLLCECINWRNLSCRIHSFFIGMSLITHLFLHFDTYFPPVCKCMVSSTVYLWSPYKQENEWLWLLPDRSYWELKE